MMKSRFEPEQWNIQISPLRPRIGIYILHTIPNTLLMKLTKDSVSKSRAPSVDDHLLYFHDHLIQQIRSPVKQYKARTGWWQYSKSKVPLLKVKLVFHVKKWFGQWNKQHARKRLFHTRNNNKKKKNYSVTAVARDHALILSAWEKTCIFTPTKKLEMRERERFWRKCGTWSCGPSPRTFLVARYYSCIIFTGKEGNYDIITSAPGTIFLLTLHSFSRWI